MNTRHLCFRYLLVSVALLYCTRADSSSTSRHSTSSSSSSSHSNKPALPRSVNFRTYSDGESPLLWNPSSQIDPQGFLQKQYVRIPSELEVGKDAIGGKHRKSKLATVLVRIRQVPGDGNCLFHSLTICLTKVENGTHFCYRGEEEEEAHGILELRRYSRILREKAVDYLASKPKRLLYLQGREYMRARDLIETAASPYGCTPEEYCETMRKESFWGGGPEVVALCNLLKRPIHIYELYPAHPTTSKNPHHHQHKRPVEFRLRRMACFGSPKFDRREALHILSADSRFPDVTPGKQLAAGNHFLAVFPMEEVTVSKLHRKKRVRGGGGGVADDMQQEQSLSRKKHQMPHPDSIFSEAYDEWIGVRRTLSMWWNFVVGGRAGQES
jgi:hypothetical protein